MRCWQESWELGTNERPLRLDLDRAMEHAHLYRSRRRGAVDDGCCSYIRMCSVPTLPRFSSSIPHSLPVHSFPSFCLFCLSLAHSVMSVFLFLPVDPPCADYLVPSSGPVLLRCTGTGVFFLPTEPIPGAHQVFYFCICPCSFIPVRRVCSREQKKKKTSARPPPRTMIGLAILSILPSKAKRYPATQLFAGGVYRRSHGLLRMPSKLPVGRVSDWEGDFSGLTDTQIRVSFWGPPPWCLTHCRMFQHGSLDSLSRLLFFRLL